MVEKGISVFLLQRFYAKLLTIHHRTDTIVAALHAEHGKVINLLAVSRFQLIELIQRNGLGNGSCLLGPARSRKTAISCLCNNWMEGKHIHY